METGDRGKYLKTLERVKGIEPSYSAWKAAALPLSYTRVVSDLTWPGAGLNRPASCKMLPFPDLCRGRRRLNLDRFAAYIGVSLNNERR